MNKTLKQLSDRFGIRPQNISLLPDWLTLNAAHRRFFYALTVLYGIYILPILLTDRPYQDDLTRSLRGVTGWTNDGRPFTEAIMKWFCGGFPVGDISPLPLILSAVFLSYTLTLYVKRNLPDSDSLYPFLYVGLAVIANPFMLSTFSYQFDCVTMIISLCAAFIPYLLPDNCALWKTFSLSGLMCLLMLVTYQPCSGVYICLCMLELLFMIHAASVDLTRLVTRACALCVSVGFYYFFVMNRYIPNSGWQPEAYRFAMGSDVSLFTAILQNYNSFAALVREYTAGVPRILLLLAAAYGIGGMSVSLMTLIGKQTGIRRIWQILYVLCLPALTLLGCLLPLLVLKPTFFTISSHTLIALCGLGTWLGIMMSFLSQKIGRLMLVFALPCILFSFTFSYTYGNAMKSQQQYEEYMACNIVHDIETLNADGQYAYLTVEGDMPYARETAMLCDKYPLYRDLVPVYINNSSYLGGALLSHYMQEDLEFTSITEEDAALLATGQPVIKGTVYSCYLNADKIIVYFHGEIF